MIMSLSRGPVNLAESPWLSVGGGTFLYPATTPTPSVVNAASAPPPFLKPSWRQKLPDVASVSW